MTGEMPTSLILRTGAQVKNTYILYISFIKTKDKTRLGVNKVKPWSSVIINMVLG